MTEQEFIKSKWDKNREIYRDPLDRTELAIDQECYFKTMQECITTVRKSCAETFEKRVLELLDNDRNELTEEFYILKNGILSAPIQETTDEKENNG